MPMKRLHLPEDLVPGRGAWETAPDINVTNIERHDIYRSPLEPSYVCWAILWREQSGALKLSFVEATGDETAWPPVYNFNSGDIEYYLKTLVSHDNAASWSDTGWREDLDPFWELNPDNHIRHVFQLPDGRLLRNYCHSLEAKTTEGRLHLYDDAKEGQGDFPFTPEPVQQVHGKFASIWTSGDGGETWEEICLFDCRPPIFITAIHPLRDGTIVALGALRPSEMDFHRWRGILTQSIDAGKSWSDPVVIVENDDQLNPQGFGEECDFVELDDGGLLVIWRTDAGGDCMRQMMLTRTADGTWQAGPAVANPVFVHSGYPYMCRASDGTIFYYCHSSIKYSCDDGATWGQIPLGFSYYGQLLEVAPGRVLAVTQKNIGDCPYPWKHDTSMLQTTFDFERIGVVEQRDTIRGSALAGLNVGKPADFHVAMELRADGATGLAYQVEGDRFRFVAVTIPPDDRRPAKARGQEQNAFLLVGTADGDRLEVVRKIWAGKLAPGTWVDLQVTRQGEVLKTAIQLSGEEGWGSTYTCVRDDAAHAGGLALFTSHSSGAFRNLRFAPAAGEIRSNWWDTREQKAKRIALDAGRAGE